MSDIKALARAKRLRRVQVEVDGETYDFNFVVPVFKQALALREDVSHVVGKLEELDGLRKSFDLVPPDRDEYENDASYADAMDVFNAGAAKALKDNPEAVQLIADKNDEVEKAVLDFNVEWLPKVCTDMKDMDEEEVANVVRLTGGNANPLTTELINLVTAHAFPTQEGLGDLPF